MPDLIRRHPLAEQAADVILGRITSGEWALGHKLPGETTLAVQLAVGRSTVREAIQQLAGRGILESRQGSGVFVLSTDASEDWDAVLHRAGIDEVIEARIAIESEAARLAAMRRSATELRAMGALLLAREKASSEGTDEEYVDADMAFHRAVIDAAHNTVLTELFDSFVPRVRQAMIDMVRIDTGRHDHRNDTDAHAEIVNAIRDKKPDAAAGASRTHLESMRRR